MSISPDIPNPTLGKQFHPQNPKPERGTPAGMLKWHHKKFILHYSDLTI